MKCPSIHKLFDGEVVFEMICVDELENGGKVRFFLKNLTFPSVKYCTLPKKTRTVLRSNHIDLFNDGVTDGI